MRTRLLLCVTALSFSFLAWGNNGQSASQIDEDHVHSYAGLAGAYYFLPLASVNAQLSSWGFKSGFTNAIGVGIDRGGEARSNRFKLPFVTYVSYHYLLPQEISTSGDSSKMKLNGYNFQFDFLGANYLNSEKVSLTAGIAWAFGRLKATENTSQGTTTFINGYFAPQLRAEFNVRIGDHFYLGARASYRYDVTKTGWKKSGVNNPDLVPTNMSGTMVGAFVGYGK